MEEYKHITNKTYATILGWMVTDLKLKGNELLVYALINGFCQDGETTFNGSLAYLQEFTSMSKQGVINTINSLIEKNLVKKIQRVINGVTFNSYQTLLVVKKFDNPVKKVDNNINNNINNKESISKDIPKKSIEDRENEFVEKCNQYVSIYGQEMIDNFTNYWLQRNEGDMKMLFEKQKVFDVKRRLVTWASKDYNKNKNNPNPPSSARPLSPSKNASDII